MMIIFAFVVLWILRFVFDQQDEDDQDGEITSGKNTFARMYHVVMLKLFVVFIFSLCASIAWRYGFFVVKLLSVPFMFPTLFIECMVVPLGMHRFAPWWFKNSFACSFGLHGHAGATYYATQALARRGATAHRINSLQQQLTYSSSSHIGYIVTRGMLAALAGQNDEARQLFQQIDMLKDVRGWGGLRRTARDWLVMDAVRQGDWAHAALTGKRGRDSFRWSNAVGCLAERLDDRLSGNEDKLSNWQLIGLWLYAPRRIALFPFVKKAIACPVRVKKVPVPRDPPLDLSAALGDFFTLVVQGTARNEQNRGKLKSDIDRDAFWITSDWVIDRLTSPRTQAQLMHRLLMLGGAQSTTLPDPAVIMSNFRGQMIDMMMSLIAQCPYLVAGGVSGNLAAKDQNNNVNENEDENNDAKQNVPGQQVMPEIINRLQQNYMRDIGTRCSDYKKRAEAQSILEPAAEWAAWVTLRSMADTLLELAPDMEDTLFQEMFDGLCSFAVFQGNELKRRNVSYDIFLWLRNHARSDPQAYELLENNVKIARHIH